MAEHKKLKVLVLSHISELLGGAERSMLDVFDHWAENYNVEPTFILREPVKSLAPAIKNRGWQCHALDYTFWSDGNPPKHKADIAHNLQKNKKAVLAIEKLIVKLKPDVVMTNSVVSPWAAIAAYHQNIPHVWFVREYGDLDHGRVYEIGREKTYADVEALSMLVVSNSETLAKYLRKYIDPKKVTTLYTPFDISAIEKLAQTKVPSPFRHKNSLKIVITGNLAPSKGQHEAIHAMGELRKQGHDVELCVVGRSGDPQYQNELNDLVATNNMKDRVHFVGYQKNPLAYVSLADVCIMASRREAFGRVTFEYLAAGKAIVGANSGATPEMVHEGSNGYLYRYGDLKSLVSALMHYVDAPKLAASHGKESKTIAIAMMQGDKNVEALYKNVQETLPTYKPTKTPLNYELYRTEFEKTYAKESKHNRDTIRVRSKRIARRYAKAAYVRARSLKTKVMGE